NLEGRVQRLRRTASPPCPDELDWISLLAARFGVEIPPYASAVFAEVSENVFGGLPFGEVGERAPLRGYVGAQEHVVRPALTEPRLEKPKKGELRLVAYKPLFSGAAVERVTELQFQRPAEEVRLAPADARALGVSAGDTVTLSQNGHSLRLRARVSGEVRSGVALVAAEHAQGLVGNVALALSTPEEAKAT